jgi:LAO/AO transport system kinase
VNDEEALAAGVRSGERRSLAKAITLVESNRSVDRSRASRVLAAVGHGDPGTVRVGISGPPGVGKSTFIEALGLHLLDQGHRVAVLAVDPSSQRSGGSILGDKTRMSMLARSPAAFIRPSPSRGEVGGIARRTGDVLLLCEAAGYDVVLVETVGVGQTEVAVSDIVDTFLLLVAAGGGDELQAIKRGIMELADVVAVTKADGDLAPAAARAEADHRHAVHFIRRRFEVWEPQVLSCSALTGAGIARVWATVLAHRAALDSNDLLAPLRREQAVRRFRAELHDQLLERYLAAPGVRERLAGAEGMVRAGGLAPTAAVDSLLRGSDDE